jgi:hypothetical protein
MKKALVVALLMLTAITATVYARDVYCPLHSYAPCTFTGEIASNGSGAQKWHCTCGDDVWVAPEPPPPQPPTPVAPPLPPAPHDYSKDGSQVVKSTAEIAGAIASLGQARTAAQESAQQAPFNAMLSKPPASEADVENAFAGLAEKYKYDKRAKKKDCKMYYDSLFLNLRNWGCGTFPEMKLPLRDGTIQRCS